MASSSSPQTWSWNHDNKGSDWIKQLNLLSVNLLVSHMDFTSYLTSLGHYLLWSLIHLFSLWDHYSLLAHSSFCTSSPDLHLSTPHTLTNQAHLLHSCEPKVSTSIPVLYLKFRVIHLTQKISVKSLKSRWSTMELPLTYISNNISYKVQSVFKTLKSN